MSAEGGSKTSDDAKEDIAVTFSEKEEEEWKKLIKVDTGKYINSSLITSQSYRLNIQFVNPSSDDIRPSTSTLREECMASKHFNKKQFDSILNKAQSIHQTTKTKAQRGAGPYADIKKGDALSIDHVIAILLYIHFPAYVALYRSNILKFYHFHRCLYEVVSYFGLKMPKDMVVYVGLTGGLGDANEEKDDDENVKKRRNDEWQFFNTAFLVCPFSACKDANIFPKGMLIVFEFV